MTLVVSSIVSCVNFLVIGVCVCVTFCACMFFLPLGGFYICMKRACVRVCVCHLLCMYVYFAIGWFLFLRETRMCACVCHLLCVFGWFLFLCEHLFYSTDQTVKNRSVCFMVLLLITPVLHYSLTPTHTVLERPPVTIGEPTSCGTTIGPFGGSDLSRAITDDVNRCLQQTQLHPGNEALHHPWSKLPVL